MTAYRLPTHRRNVNAMKFEVALNITLEGNKEPTDDEERAIMETLARLIEDVPGLVCPSHKRYEVTDVQPIYARTT